MPNIGDLVHASTIGWKANRYVQWDVCPQCGAGKWQHRSLPLGRPCRSCQMKNKYIVSRQEKMTRAQQLLSEHKEAVLMRNYGCGQVNQVLRREFGSGLLATTVSDMANEIRSQNALTHRTCCRCGKEQPIVEFQWGRTMQRMCATCHREKDRLYYAQTKECRQSNRRRVYHSDPEHVLKRVRRDTSIYDAVRKIQVLSHYGSSKCACVVCGEDDIACLSIDHIGGGGAQHRKVIGSHFYLHLIKQGFPEGYQTLCMNCQFKKRFREREHRTLENLERSGNNERYSKMS